MRFIVFQAAGSPDILFWLFCVYVSPRRPAAFLTSLYWTSCVRSCCFYASLRSGRPRPPVRAGAPVFAVAWVHRLQAVHSLDVSRRFLFGCDGAALRRAVICLELRRRDRSVACPSLYRKASLRTCCRLFSSIHRAISNLPAQAPSRTPPHISSKTQNRQGTFSLPMKKHIKSQNSSAGNANGSSDVRAVSSGSTT